MRCSKCHSRMEEETKDSILKGTTIINHCKRCDNEVVEHVGGSFFSNIFHFKQNAIEVDEGRARSINLH